MIHDFEKPKTKFDHGEINIPGRLKNIDREIQRNAEQVRRDEVKRGRERAKQFRIDKVKAKSLHAKHAAGIIEKNAGKYDAKELAKELDRLAKWDPEKFIKIVEQETGATQ